MLRPSASPRPTNSRRESLPSRYCATRPWAPGSRLRSFMLVSPQTRDPELIIHRIVQQPGRGGRPDASGSALVSPVEFPGPAAVVLRGLLFGQGRCCVVLVHDVGHDLDRWREQAFWLAEHGFRVLAVDM